MRSTANRPWQRARESMNASVLSRDFVTNMMVKSDARPAKAATLTHLDLAGGDRGVGVLICDRAGGDRGVGVLICDRAGGDRGVGVLICDRAGSDGGVGCKSCARQASRKRLYHDMRSRECLPKTA